MVLGKGGGDHLERLADTDAQRVRAGDGQRPVVVAFAAAEAATVLVEGESRAEEGVDVLDCHGRAVCRRFSNAEGAEGQLVPWIRDVPEFDLVATDDGEHPAVVRVLGDERQQVDFVRQCGVGRDGHCCRSCVEPGADLPADGIIAAGGMGELLAHGSSQLLFAVGFQRNCHLPRWMLLVWCIAVMHFWQVMAISGVLCGLLPAQDAPPRIDWQPLRVAKSIFPRQMGLMDNEREDYANHLVGIAVQQIVAKKASPESLALGRKMIALALHLSPKNKRAVVANFRLSKGQLPEKLPADLQPSSFSRLLISRAQLLGKVEGEGNLLCARYFFDLAGELDPENEDAVYQSELQRIQNGEVDWAQLTSPPAK